MRSGVGCQVFSTIFSHKLGTPKRRLVMKVVRDLTPSDWTVPEMPTRYLLDLRGECNLSCPMCLLHGAPDTPEKEASIGKMSVENARKILDEIMGAKPLIQPAMWGEPLLAKNFKEHIAEMKARGISVAMNTNGLTLREEMARYLVQQKVDAVFFSMDSMTPETLKKVRGVDKLDKIAKNVMMLLRVREEMKSIYPRVGVTFTIQEENKHELEAFIDHWIKIADLVRTGYVFENGRLTEVNEPEQRVPCGMMYDTMPIHYNGDVSLCCFDSHRRAIMGNVFKDGGVKAVWHGEKFTEVRRLHEAGQYDKVPFCKDCNAWTGRVYREEISERAGVKILLRRSPQFVYYNRLDRLESWHDQLSGHAKLDREALCTSD